MSALDKFRQDVEQQMAQDERARQQDRALVGRAVNVAGALRELGYDAAATLDGRVTLILTAEQAGRAAEKLGPVSEASGG